MGFFDSISNGFNNGKASIDRSTRIMRLKNQINEATKRRTQLETQLGASLYEATRGDPVLRAGREDLYDGIAQCDAERAQCQYEIDAINAEAEAARIAAQGYECPRCHTHIDHGDSFCSGCGLPVSEILAAQGQGQFGAGAPEQPGAGTIPCPSCGEPTNPGDIFCMSCGAKLPGSAAAGAQAPSPAQPTPGVSPYELAQARYGSPEAPVTPVPMPTEVFLVSLDSSSEQGASHTPAHMGAPLSDDDDIDESDDLDDVDNADDGDDKSLEENVLDEIAVQPEVSNPVAPDATPAFEPHVTEEPVHEPPANVQPSESGPFIPGELREDEGTPVTHTEVRKRTFPVLNTSDAAVYPAPKP